MTATMLGSIAIGGFDGVSLDMLIRQGFRPVPITGTQALTPDVLAVDLSPAEANATIAPGSHVEVAVPLPDGPAIRHYSLVAGDGEAGSLRIAILREAGGRGGSTWLHEHLPECTSMLIRGPRDTFGYLGVGPVLFVAGGIGITPITAMAAAAAAAGIDWHLLYIGRRREAMAFAQDLLRDHGPERVTVHITEEEGRPDVIAIARRWAAEHAGHTTAVDEPVTGFEVSAGTTVYTCGPVPLMRTLELGLAEEADITVVSEDFSSVMGSEPARARTDQTSRLSPGRSTPPGGGTVGGTASANEGEDDRDDGESGSQGRGDHPFVVELSDGSEVDVPNGCSIIDALGSAGVRTLSSCQKGTCGTCETLILDGTADHRDSVLSPEEHAGQETMMICVSRACGDRITLDL